MSDAHRTSDTSDFCSPVAYADRVRSVLEKLQQLYAPSEAVLWLLSPQPVVWNDRPAMLLTTPGGTVKVHETIQRILDGAYV